MATLTLEKMAGGGMYDQLGGRVPSLLDRRRLAGAALREDALRQRAAGRRVRRGVPGHRARRLRARRARDARLPAARDDRARRRFLSRRPTPTPKERTASRRKGSSSSGRSRRSRESRPGRRRRPLHRATTASRAGGNFEGENILHVARPDEGEWAALADARAALYAVARQAPAAAARREDPGRLERPGDLRRSPSAGRVLDEPRYVAAAARAADASSSTGCARTGGWCAAAKDGRDRRRRRSSTTRPS